MKKRLISLLLAMMLVLSIVPANVIFAASDMFESTAVLTVEEKWTHSGEFVDVNINIAENPGILGAKINVSWDERLIFVSAESGEAFAHMTYNAPNSYQASGSNFVWFSNDVCKVVDGTVLKITFKAPETEENDVILPVRVTYKKGDIFDGNENNVTLDTTDGFVRIITYEPGDVNGDKRVNMRDLVALSQYVSDDCVTDPNGYNVTVNEKAGDVNGDGTIDLRDLVRLSRYISDECTTDPESYNVALDPAKLPDCSHPTMIKNDGKAPTCTEYGVKVHWYCPECGKYFDDEAGTIALSLAETELSAVGHSVSKVEKVEPTYTEPGVAEHWKCVRENCGKLFADEKAETMISANDTVISPKKSYQIQYDLYDENSTYLAKVGVENPNAAYYDPELGLVLQDLNAEGYEFKGWFDDDGKRVREIKAGTEGIIGLSAKWQPITYKLYKRDLVNDTEMVEFTAESSIELETPTWRHLTFSHWYDVSGKLKAYTDANGVERLRIEQGTILEQGTDYIEVVAKWRNPINRVVNNNSNDNLIGCKYESEAQMYWFVYEIGKIEKVILGNIDDYEAQQHSGLNTTLTYTESVEMTESTEKSITNLSSSTVSNSQSLNETLNQVVSLSETLGMTVKTGIESEVGKEGIAKVKGSIETETRLDLTVGAEEGISKSKEKSETITKENAQEVCNNFVYSNTYRYEESNSRSLTPEDPVGFYRCVNAATLKLYAVVIYDPATMTCYLETYSVVSDTYLYPLYEREGYVDYANDSIDYAIDEKAILAYVTSAYYIQYDAYEGDEVMPIDVATKDGDFAIRSDFTKEGYTLSGWKYTNSDGLEKIIIATPNLTVNNLTEAGKTVTLKAIWSPNIYEITYNGNGATNGSTAPSEHAYDKEKELTANGFVREYTVKYNYTGSGAASTTAIAKYSFAGWVADNGIEYEDGASVLNLKSKNGATVEMTAKWIPASVTLPNPTRSGHTFDGWYSDENYSNFIGKGGAAYIPGSDVTLYAKWLANTVSFNSNGGSSVAAQQITASGIYGTLPTPTRADYAFVGWYYGSTKVTSGMKVVTQGNHTLIAKWVKVYAAYSQSWDEHSVDDGGLYDPEEVYVSTGFNRNDLISAGYTQLYVEIVMTADRYSLVNYRNNPYVNFLGTNVYFDRVGKNASTQTRSTSVFVNTLSDNGVIKFTFSTDGGDAYDLYNVQIRVTAR